MTKLPVSLTALRAFVEAARCGSMRRAGESLGVTAGAVSQQVKIVEDGFEVRVFQRTNNDLKLTKEGECLLNMLNEPFRRIEEAVSGFQGSRYRGSTLTITTVPSFAASWLVPRLGHFAKLFPHIEVRVETEVPVVDLRRRRIDCAIRHGSGKYKGMHVTHLVTPSLLPIGSSQLLRSGSSIKTASDCLRYPLLQDLDRSEWANWFKAYDVCDPDGLASRGSSLADDSLLIQGAASSQGLALVRDVYAAKALRDGIVKVAINLPLKTSASYYFVTKPEISRDPRIVAFKNWLLAEIADSRAG